MYGYIYKITCLVNGKIYIGQKIRTPEDSKGYLGSGSKIQRAVKRHGKENFVKEVLAICETIEEANLLEEKYIKFYNSTDKNKGYNILPCSPLQLTTEGSNVIREVISKANKGKKHSEEFRKKKSELNTGSNNPFYGKKHTKEVINKFTNTINSKPNEVKAARNKQNSETKQVEWATRSKEEVKEFGSKVSEGHKNRTPEQKEATALLKSINSKRMWEERKKNAH